MIEIMVIIAAPPSQEAVVQNNMQCSRELTAPSTALTIIVDDVIVVSAHNHSVRVVAKEPQVDITNPYLPAHLGPNS